MRLVRTTQRISWGRGHTTSALLLL